MIDPQHMVLALVLSDVRPAHAEKAGAAPKRDRPLFEFARRWWTRANFWQRAKPSEIEYCAACACTC